MNEFDEVIEQVNYERKLKDFWLVVAFVDGIVKHGFYEDTMLRMSSKEMDTIRYGMVAKSHAKTPQDAAKALVEGFAPEIRERIRTARVGHVSAPVEVLLAD